MIRIGIVDDHKVVRAGLRAYLCLEPDFAVIGEAGDGREALELVRSQVTDVLLMDLSMPGQSGLDVMAMIRAKAPDTRILILTGHAQAHYAVKLIRSGAAGFLSKEGDPMEIANAIRVVAQGRRFITPAVAELMAGALLQPDEKAAHERLSQREFQIFLKIARGAKSIEISDQLFISPKTVVTNRVHIMAKLGVSTISEVTYYALKHGLID